MHAHFLFGICFAHFMSRHTPSIASVREIGGVWLSLALSAAAPKTSLLAPRIGFQNSGVNISGKHSARYREGLRERGDLESERLLQLALFSSEASERIRSIHSTPLHSTPSFFLSLLPPPRPPSHPSLFTIAVILTSSDASK